MTKEIVLASASPSRKRLLESIGIAPIIKVSGVDEEAPEILALKPAELVIALAILKAHTVHQNFPELTNSLIIGCDSTFESMTIYLVLYLWRFMTCGQRRSAGSRFKLQGFPKLSACANVQTFRLKLHNYSGLSDIFFQMMCKHVFVVGR